MAAATGFSALELDSPLGPLLVATTDTAVVCVSFHGQDWDARLDALESSLGEPRDTPTALVERTAEELDEYFGGLRKQFTVPVATVFGAQTEFRLSVLGGVAAIPFGETRSYGDIARSAGRPDAVRATGTAIGSNPVAIIVPCHRVVRSDGTIGGFAGGSERKSRLLEFERSLTG